MAALSLSLRRRATVEPAIRAALRDLVARPLFELIPLRDAVDPAAYLPPGSLVSVTASPARGMEATIVTSARLRELGHTVVPHLAAHMIRDRAHLSELLRRMDDAGIDRAFVVGGDAPDPGQYRDGLSLLRAMVDLGHRLREIGVGLPHVEGERRDHVLRRHRPNLEDGRVHGGARREEHVRHERHHQQ